MIDVMKKQKPSPEPLEQNPTDTRIDELRLRWTQLRARGETLSPAELAGDTPELVDELAQWIAATGAEESAIASTSVQGDDPTATKQPSTSETMRGTSYPADCFTAVSHLVEARFHARGGLGEVLVARQQELDRSVALKRILPGQIHDASRRRFLREAVITAQLQHPGIVPIHDLGEDECGPFYTMPFVRGETLQVAIERFHRDQALRRDPGRRGLELRGLLQRFITICETIAYAHDQGVVHRDLKPSNIMLGPYGETLVMDWGLAKRYQGDGSDTEHDADVPSPSPSPNDLTALGAVLGTPQFMSPEQALGRPTSPSSDLYSLGVILYAILIGKSPYAVPPGPDRLQLVREAALVPPRQRDPSLSRALQAICLKAMAARPEDRYMTPRALAEDLAKWLADEPVSAYRQGYSARLARWARRHRAGVQAATVALVVVAVLATTAAVRIDQARRGEQAALVRVTASLAAERAAKAEAEANLTLARQAVDDYFTKISENSLLKRQDAAEVRDLRPLRKELLEVALEYYNRLITRRSSDPSLRSEQAAAYTRVGRINGEIGSKDAALEAYRHALVIRTDLAALHPDDNALARQRAASGIPVAEMLTDIGRTGEALAEYTRSQELLQRLVDADPSDIETQSELMRVHNGEGLVLRALGRSEDALAAFERGRAAVQRLADAGAADSEDRSRLATAHSNIGLFLGELGRIDQAVAAMDKCRSIYQALVDANPTASRYQNDLGATDNNLGLLLSGAGRHTEALAALVRGREVLERLVRAHPSVTTYHRDLATNYINSGNAYSATNRPTEALAEFERARTILQPLIEADPADVENRRNLAATLFNIGDALRETRRIAEARGPAEQACTVLAAMADRSPFDEFVRACAHDLCADLLDKQSGSPSASDRARREDHVAKAMDALRRAIAGGYRAVDPKNFSVLQSRNDFQNMMLDLAFPEWPFAGKLNP
jgi:eukaryotic-like serine/threonine-protein kinase